MENWPATVRRAVVAAGGFSAVIVLLDRGLGSLVGWLLAGALIASWAHVYARIMCAGQRLEWRLLLSAAGWGALAMPAAAVAAGWAGPGVWLALGVALAAWLVLVKPDGRVPARVREGLRAAQSGALELLRGR